MNSEAVMAVLLLAVLIETSYLSYRTVRRTSATNNNSILVDTSVLIDGRILPLATTGFIPGDLVIPRSVIGELQLLADGSDSEKRERARRGLDVARDLQTMAGVNVSILADGSRAPEGVDERLLTLAKKHDAKLLTIDYNLNKVAQVEDIIVLNINDLAKQLRMSYLPGDVLNLDLTSPGSDGHQAVGHLEDGTMVVVEQARKLLGKRAEVEIIRSLQTSAGKMMFAKLHREHVEPVVKKQMPTTGRRPAKNNTPKPVQTGRPVQQTEQSKNTKKPNNQRRRNAKQHEASLVDLANR